jgi:DMSO/TMAO reductase YedYZ molybdopterin-dependent catalytic subunit
VSEGVSLQELQLATRNHGMPLEALRYSVTPIGLHYLLIHYDIPMTDPDEWRLRVDGYVEHELVLSISDLRAMPSTTRVLTMECAGNGRALLAPRPSSQPWLVEAVGTGEWTGVELQHLLMAAGLQHAAVEVLFTGADRGVEGGVEQWYQRSLSVRDAVASGALLAYDLNGAQIPPQHGFPLRLVVPGWYGMTNVKWLSAITAIDTTFDGYQQTVGYRVRADDEDPGTPVTRMVPRALLCPPGVPDFFSRARTVDTGECVLMGRAWSGAAPVANVEVSVDGGENWSSARLDDEDAVAGRWIGWSFAWRAQPGDYELCCRATDAAGTPQPLAQQWNVGGYANNAVHRVPVRVIARNDHQA